MIPSWAATADGNTKRLPQEEPAGGVSVSKKWRCRRHCCHSIVAGTTAVVPARFVSHLRVANRLRRLCPPGTRFPAVPAGFLGRLTAVNRNEDLARQCQRRRLRLRNGAPKSYAAAFFPRTSLRMHNTEDEDSPERATAVRSPRPVGERAAEHCSRAMAANQYSGASRRKNLREACLHFHFSPFRSLSR